MDKTNLCVYFKNIKINICISDVLSEKADTCIVPQPQKGISLTGVCADFLQTKARNSIINYQNFVKGRSLDPTFVFSSPCNDDRYQHLIHIPVLASTPNDDKETIFSYTSIGVFAALQKASELKAKKVVLPSINTGSKGVLDYKDAAVAILVSIEQISYIRANSIKEIMIVLKDKKAYKAFQEILLQF